MTGNSGALSKGSSGAKFISWVGRGVCADQGFNGQQVSTVDIIIQGANAGCSAVQSKAFFMADFTACQKNKQQQDPAFHFHELECRVPSGSVPDPAFMKKSVSKCGSEKGAFISWTIAPALPATFHRSRVSL